MADTSGTQLNPAIQPFFPSNQARSTSGSETDGSQRMMGSPASMEHHLPPLSDDERRTSPYPGPIGRGNDNQPSPFAAGPPTGGFMHPIFQDYSIRPPSSRDAFRSDTESSNRSNSPARWNRHPSTSLDYLNAGTTPRMADIDDIHNVNDSFSPNDNMEPRSGTGTARNSVSTPQMQNDLRGGGHLSNAFATPPIGGGGGGGVNSRPNSFLAPVGSGRASSFRLSGNEQSFMPSPVDARENSTGSSIDYSDGPDDLNPTPHASYGPNGRAFSLQIGSMSNASTRSFSSNNDLHNTTRGTTPFSQPYEEHLLSGVGGISLGNSSQSGGPKLPFLQPPNPNGVNGHDRNSLSRASSRSMSMNSNGQVYDRPPSSFDAALHGPLDGFEAQLKASPFINDLLDRLLRCEYSTKEIQRELSEVLRKMAILERAVDGGRSSQNVQPAVADELRSLNQRVQALTTSVTQLLALQAQTQLNSMNLNGSLPVGNGLGGPLSALGSGSANGLSPLQTGGLQGAGTPNGSLLSGGPMTPNSLNGMNVNGLNMGGNGSQGLPSVNGGNAHPSHVLPNRPDVGGGFSNQRQNSIRSISGAGGPIGNGNAPQRTWSVGNADMLPRRDSEVGLGGSSANSGMNGLLRDKRKMSINVLRRDSTASTIGDDSSARERDNGPVVSKWEHLPLVPDLLRSINKYGIGPPNKIQQRALPFLLRGSDIIAQAPPTQERIAAYIIPAIHVALTNSNGKPPNRGPIVVIISTTVDQATQAQRMIRDLGGPIGIRSALGVGTGGDIVQELRLLQQSMPHILCGTPQKLHALFTSPGGLPGGEVRFLVLDEVDQLIARNLHEFVFNIVKLFPTPRSKSAPAPASTSTTPAVGTPSSSFNPFDGPSGAGRAASPTNSLRRFSMAPNSEAGSSNGNGMASGSVTPGANSPPERQTALFSNTVPQDVLNLANAIQLREPVRVLVRRDGNVTHADTSNGARGLRQFYLYLAFTGGARGAIDAPSRPDAQGAGVIGSGRGATNAETAQAREWKVDALADLFDDMEISHAIVHVGGLNALEAVIYKLVSRGFEAVPLHNDMVAGAKLAALNKFRGPNAPLGRPPITRVLVVYDVQIKPPDVQQVPLIINYDLPKVVEEYAHRVAPAVSSSYSRAGVVVNFVTATGGDVEMLRSIECFYKIKCPEVPLSLREIL